MVDNDERLSFYFPTSRPVGTAPAVEAAAPSAPPPSTESSFAQHLLDNNRTMSATDTRTLDLAGADRTLAGQAPEARRDALLTRLLGGSHTDVLGRIDGLLQGYTTAQSDSRFQGDTHLRDLIRDLRGIRTAIAGLPDGQRTAEHMRTAALGATVDGVNGNAMDRVMANPIVVAGQRIMAARAALGPPPSAPPPSAPPPSAPPPSAPPPPPPSPPRHRGPRRVTGVGALFRALGASMFRPPRHHRGPGHRPPRHGPGPRHWRR